MAIDNTNVPKTLYTAGHDVYNSDLENERDNQIIEMLYRVITSNGRFGVIDTKVLGTKLRVSDIGGETIQISPGFALDGWGKRTGLLTAHNQLVSGGAYDGKYVCIKARTTPGGVRAHPVTGVNSITKEVLDTNPLNIIYYLDSIPPDEVNDWIVLDKIITVSGGVVTLASNTMTAAEFAKIRKVFSAQSVWWNQSGPGGTTISPSVTDGCTLEEFLACKGSGVRTLNNPLGLTLDDIAGGLLSNHLRGSHRTGIHPISDINRSALRPTIAGANLTLYPLQVGEYIQVDNKVWTASDITSYLITFTALDYGNTFTVYFDHTDPYPKKILYSLESTLVNGELKICRVTLDAMGGIIDVIDHYTVTGGPYRQEAFYSTKARDIGVMGHVLKWFPVGAQEGETIIYDTYTTYDNSGYVGKGIILIPAASGTPQVKIITSVADGGSPPGVAHKAYGVATPWSPTPVAGDLVGIFDVGDLGLDNLQHIIDSIWSRFNATLGHKHTGGASDAPLIESGGLATVNNRTVQWLANNAFDGSEPATEYPVGVSLFIVEGEIGSSWPEAPDPPGQIWGNVMTVKFLDAEGGGHYQIFNKRTGVSADPVTTRNPSYIRFYKDGGPDWGPWTELWESKETVIPSKTASAQDGLLVLNGSLEVVDPIVKAPLTISSTFDIPDAWEVALYANNPYPGDDPYGGQFSFDISNPSDHPGAASMGWPGYIHGHRAVRFSKRIPVGQDPTNRGGGYLTSRPIPVSALTYDTGGHPIYYPTTGYRLKFHWQRYTSVPNVRVLVLVYPLRADFTAISAITILDDPGDGSQLPLNFPWREEVYDIYPKDLPVGTKYLMVRLIGGYNIGPATTGVGAVWFDGVTLEPKNFDIVQAYWSDLNVGPGTEQIINFKNTYYGYPQLDRKDPCDSFNYTTGTYTARAKGLYRVTIKGQSGYIYGDTSLYNTEYWIYVNGVKPTINPPLRFTVPGNKVQNADGGLILSLNPGDTVSFWIVNGSATWMAAEAIITIEKMGG